MKKTLALFGVVACVLGVSSLQASPDTSAANAVSKSKYPSKSTRAVVYITTVPAAGSHLPLVVRRYKDSVDCMSPMVSYGKPQLDQTGQLNVGAQLVQHEPSLAGFSGGGILRR